MTIQQQIEDASLDFESLILDGREVEPAVTEAARANGLEPTVLKARLSRNSSLEELADTLRRKAAHDRFLAVAEIEVQRFKDRDEPYRSMKLGLLDIRQHAAAVAQEVAAKLHRPLEQPEIDKVSELLNPWATDFELKIKYGLEPLNGPLVRK